MGDSGRKEASDGTSTDGVRAEVKPEKEEGYAEVSCELLMAVLESGFTRGAGIVLGNVLIQIYGPFKAKLATLDRKAILKGSDIPADAHVRRAIKELVDWNVLSKASETQYKFNKYYNRWQFEKTNPDGSSETVKRLTPEQVEYCRSLRPFKRTNSGTDTESGQNASRTNNDTAGQHINSHAVPNEVRKRTNFDTGRTNFDTDALKERAPGELKREERNTPQPPRGGRLAGELDFSEQTARASGPGKNSAAALALEKWAEPFGTDPKFMSYGFWARESCEHYPAEWVRLAIEDHVVGRSSRPYVGKLTAVLARYAEQGHADRKRVRNEDRPAPPSASLKGDNVEPEGYEELKMRLPTQAGRGNVANAVASLQKRLGVEPEGAS